MDDGAEASAGQVEVVKTLSYVLCFFLWVAGVYRLVPYLPGGELVVNPHGLKSLHLPLDDGSQLVWVDRQVQKIVNFDHGGVRICDGGKEKRERKRRRAVSVRDLQVD